MFTKTGNALENYFCTRYVILPENTHNKRNKRYELNDHNHDNEHLVAHNLVVEDDNT